MLKSVRARLSAMALITAIAVVLLSGVTLVVRGQIAEVISSQTDIQAAVGRAGEMRNAMTTMVLVAMDSIVDKSEGKITPERLEELAELEKSFEEGLEGFKDYQNPDIQKKIAILAEKYDIVKKGIHVDLEAVLAKAGKSDEQFAALDDSLDGRGGEMGDQLQQLRDLTVEAQKQLFASNDNQAAAALTPVLLAIAEASAHNTGINLAAMDVIVDRKSGAIAPELAEEISASSKVMYETLEMLGSQPHLASHRALIGELRGKLDAQLAEINNGLKQTVETVGNADGLFAELDDVIDGNGADIDETLSEMLEILDAEAVDARSNTQETLANAAISSLSIGGLILVISLFFSFRVSRAILSPLNGVREAMKELADGDLTVTVPGTQLHDEIGAMARAADRFKQVGVSALRAQSGLDSVSSNVMMTDNSGKIVYFNRAATEMAARNEADIKKVIPEYSAKDLIGKQFSEIYYDPKFPKNFSDDLNATAKSSMEMAGLHFDMVANPVFGSRQERLGAVIEWKEKTLEQRVELEIASMVDAAVAGNLSQRIELSDKRGFFRRLSEGINKLSTTVSMVAEDLADNLGALSQGDLTRRMTAQYDGVFGQLRDDYNQTVEKLTEIVGRITDASNSINSGASEIAAGNENLSSRTESQASSLEQTATAMEQITTTVQTNAENAKTADASAARAKSAAIKGSSVAAQAVSAMSRISQSSSKIADIIGVIDEIAFQTNLLALNAAVEAARAGEAGRGFAVVAQEVRSLAQRSSSASKEIKDLITAGSVEVKEGVDLVNSAGSSLNQIEKEIASLAEMLTDISRASNEQAVGLSEINRAVAKMDEMTQQNSELVSESAAAARSMEEQANDLLSMIEFFRLDEASGKIMSPTLAASLPNRLSLAAPKKSKKR